MPSSENENPHKMASPYEFFIVQQSQEHIILMELYSIWRGNFWYGYS